MEQSNPGLHLQTIRHAQNSLLRTSTSWVQLSSGWRTWALSATTIPVEITTKICIKMHAGERFTAYIVIPMWPEGDPTSAPMQAILYWQTRTIEMMSTERLEGTLREANVPPHLGQHPLTGQLFCLARESVWLAH